MEKQVDIMKIKKIYYHLFNSDWDDIKTHINKLPHIIDGEIELQLYSKKSIYISWTNSPVMYSIGCSETTWCGNLDVSIEVSNWDIWKYFIDKEIKLIFLGKDNQILKIGDDKKSIYINSYENNNWFVDVVYISDVMLDFN